MRCVPTTRRADWTLPGVYEVDARLPDPVAAAQDGLRAVNVYAVRDGDGLVMVDSGWAITEARELLEQAVKLLDGSLTRCAGSSSRTSTGTITRWPSRAQGVRHADQPWAAERRHAAGGAGAGHGPRAPCSASSTGAARTTWAAGTQTPGARWQDWADPDEWLDAPEDIELETGSGRRTPRPGTPAGTSCSSTPAAT